MDFDVAGPVAGSWEKVTRKIVDPITFSSSVSFTFVPRVEDCSYETTCEAFCNPRVVGNPIVPPLSSSATTTTTTTDTTWTPMDFATGTPITKSRRKTSSNNKGGQKPGKLPFDSPTKATKSPSKKSSSKTASLGAFFKKDATQKMEDLDNQSISSRSMNSRSIADRSYSERSKSEMELSKKAKDKRNNGKDKSGGMNDKSPNKKTTERRHSKESSTMMSIDESSETDFNVDIQGNNNSNNNKPKGELGNFLQQNAITEENAAQKAIDQKSVMSGSTLGSKSVTARSNAELSKAEKKLRDKEKAKGANLSSVLGDAPVPILKNGNDDDDDDEKSLTMEDVGPVEKKLRFKEGHDEKEIPWPTDSMYDDLFYTSEELADFRYEAFLEEAGLDVNEFM